MPKILTRLRIDEVSAVDRGAGEGVKILLMKRNAERWKRHEREWCARQVSYDKFAKIFGVRTKAADQPKKEYPMDRQTTLHEIAKQYGIIRIAKDIADRGNAFGISEHELTALATEHAQQRYPDKTPDAAFAKLYSGNDADGLTLRKAIAVAKAMPFVADGTPTMVGGADTRDLSDQSEAIAQLKELGARKWPTASEAQQFERAITDSANVGLARKAHQRPQAPANGVYEFPR